MNRRVGNEVRLGWEAATMTGSWDLEDANINVTQVLFLGGLGVHTVHRDTILFRLAALEA